MTLNPTSQVNLNVRMLSIAVTSANVAVRSTVGPDDVIAAAAAAKRRGTTNFVRNVSYVIARARSIGVGRSRLISRSTVIMEVS